jgi:hypothetical protein
VYGWGVCRDGGGGQLELISSFGAAGCSEAQRMACLKLVG